MKFNEADVKREYQQLCRKLADIGWISHGYYKIVAEGLAASAINGAANRGKTISGAISKEQYIWLKEAIENWRKIQDVMKRMENLSLTTLFKTIPDTFVYFQKRNTPYGVYYERSNCFTFVS